MRKIGDFGENIAVTFLVKQGFKVLLRNYEVRFGEIDIIGRAYDGTVVFFEVKTMNSSNLSDTLAPEDHLTISKLKKLRRTCRLFVGKHPKLIDEKVGWRIDLLAIILNSYDSVEGPRIRHYKNI